MNAGRQLFVRSIRDFSTFVHTPDAERIKLVQQGIMLEPQLIEAYRIRGSFTDFRYYTWVCFEFIDSAGVSRYVRFRLINHDRGPDRGLPNAAFRANGRPSMDRFRTTRAPPTSCARISSTGSSTATSATSCRRSCATRPIRRW